MTERSDYRRHHRREAARLRALAAVATTGQVKARLVEEAEKHERLTQFDDHAAREEA
jgi:hypothetical protein